MAEPSAVPARMPPRQLGVTARARKGAPEVLQVKAFSASLPRLYPSAALSRSLCLFLWMQRSTEKTFALDLHTHSLRFCIGALKPVAEAWAAFTGSLDVQGGSGDVSLFCGRLVGERGCVGESWPINKVLDVFRFFSECLVFDCPADASTGGGIGVVVVVSWSCRGRLVMVVSWSCHGCGRVMVVVVFVGSKQNKSSKSNYYSELMHRNKSYCVAFSPPPSLVIQT